MRYVDAAVESLLPQLAPGAVVVGVDGPGGTAERLAEVIAAAEPEGTLVWNPEFLHEGKAVQDTLSPAWPTRPAASAPSAS